MHWYKIHLTQKQTADGFAEYIARKLHEKVLLSAADRKTLIQLAAFQYPANGSDRDGSQTYYISPTLAVISPEILSEGNAEPCDPPTHISEKSMDVLVSWDDNEAAWSVLRSLS